MTSTHAEPVPGRITRRRTGCTQCRERHRRCDEEKPVCRQCAKRSLPCNFQREMKVFFYQSSTSPKKSVQPPQSPDETTGSAVSDQDGAEQIQYSSPTLSLPPSQISPGIGNGGIRRVSSDNGLTQGQRQDDLSSICLSQSAQFQNLVAAEPLLHGAPTFAQPEVFQDWSSLQASRLVQEAMASQLEVELTHNYVVEVAPWFDAHTGERYFSCKELRSMLQCPPWRAAAMALSAKSIELRDRRTLASAPNALSLHLYQLAVRLAMESLTGKYDSVGTLAGCVLLSVYEMMTVDYRDWRRHLRGCATIYSHHSWNGSTGGLISGAFWDYARIDIWAAVCLETTPVFPPSKYFDRPEEILASHDVFDDLHSQIAIWLMARVVEMVYDKTPLELNDEYVPLRAAMDNWEAMGGCTTKALVKKDPDVPNDQPFPAVSYSSHSAALGHKMFHTAMILLLRYEVLNRPFEATTLGEEAYKHGLQVCGIVGTNNNHPLLVNAVQPVYIAGQVLKTKCEKFAALQLSSQIEHKTGWQCKWRSDSLRQLWNLC